MCSACFLYSITVADNTEILYLIQDLCIGQDDNTC